DIYWEQVVNFKEKVWSKTEQIIKSIFQAEVKIATEAIDEAIAFYNNFLELQNRYQQETPEQREAEKAWIDQQRQQLNQVQQGIKEILNQSAG
ncbi:MAG TPA: dynamin family protein, partial [Cyanobacteria bacterium UBA11372]|nr:dynamin family protein [Cyanobacteria bacterium UBA11372]